jgi:transcriptional regulator with XRE-family HTH domain
MTIAISPTRAKRQTDVLDVEIGKRIRLHRIEAKMSQSQLAEALGLTLRQIRKYEKGTNHCAPSHIEKIAEAVGIPAVQMQIGAAATPARVGDARGDARQLSNSQQSI